MELRGLGFDRWFAEKAREYCAADLAIARVTAVDRARYLIRDEHDELPAELTGRFQFVAESSVDLPCVGDWVCARRLDGGSHASIHGVLPRKSFLRRKAPGKDIDFQMIAANIDVAFVIQACHFDFNVRRLERYLVMVRERVITVSNVTGVGLDRVRELLIPGRTCCLLGSSGVGKTTLINRLSGDGGLATGDVSHTGEGRHTTTRRELIVLESGALLIDMPGMRELGMLGVNEGLDDAFADVGQLARNCRFTDCGHSSEPGCAVRAAIERRELSDERLQDYLKLRKESAFHDLSYVERRKRDRDFGRFVHSAMKHKARQGKDTG